MSKRLTLSLDDDTYRLFAETAKAERRTVESLVETAAVARIIEEQFVDEYEMEGIRGDADLLKRLRQGSRDARDREGRFVE